MQRSSTATERKSRVWLTATALLGMTFIGGQVYEFTTFVSTRAVAHDEPLLEAFFVLTGFHGTHVTIGIMMLLTARRDVAGRRRSEQEN